MASSARRLSPRTLLATAVALAAAAACERGSPGVRRDAGTAARDAAPAEPWSASIGTLIGTPLPGERTFLVFARDTLPRDTRVALIGHDTTTARAGVRLTTRAGNCSAARTATVVGASGPGPWPLLLDSGIARPLRIESVADQAPRDSAALVARLSRLVSALPDDSAATPFRGLPIVIREAWRVASDSGQPTVIAIAARTLNMESNPRTELVTLVAEPPTDAPASEPSITWYRRVSGPEDRVETTDLLGAMRLADGALAVALLREAVHDLAIEILTREPGRGWTLRWSSTALGCGG